MAIRGPLAQLGSNGLLPEGVHLCDESEFAQRFVEDFPDSASRPAIRDGFMRLRAEAFERGISATQWVDGSFVTSKCDPNDVDVVTFVDYDTLNSMDTSIQDFVSTCLNGRTQTIVDYSTHTFVIPCCGPEHPYHGVFEGNRLYWRRWFGRTKSIPDPPVPDLEGSPKGIVEMAIGDGPLVPAISDEGG